MKGYCIIFIIGIVIGGVITYLVMASKPARVQSSQVITTTHHKDDIQLIDDLRIKQKGKFVEIGTRYQSSYYGTLDIKTSLMRSDIERKHALTLGAGLINRALFIYIGYIYKRFECRLYSGYNIKSKEVLAGASFGYQIFKW